MKKITNILFSLISFLTFSQVQNLTGVTLLPNPFQETQSITITVPGTSVNEASWGVTGNALYLWAWSFDLNLANILDCPTNGAWTNSSETNRFIYTPATDTYTYTFTPTTFYNRSNIGRLGFLVKAKNGTGDKKSQDFLYNVGLFQLNLTAPVQNSTTVLNSGGSLNITANNTGGNANYVLSSNGTVLNTQNNISSYTFNHTNITTNQSYSLDVTQGATTLTKKFSVLVNPNTITQALPAGMEIGVNLNPTDNTKATLVLNAPGKDFVYVAGNFNNYSPNATYAMKKDTGGNKFWLELTGLTPGADILYQYWVVDQTPVANSPTLIKVADPCATLVISPFDDPGISSASFPNIPAYPVGQQREISWFKTVTTPYNWQVVNFVKPNKDKLVVYEVLVRDFDADRNYQDIIDKINYFKNLGVNAIQLMPVMEYEGNESWGYNTAFHMALDKFYGTPEKFKELVDLCHTNGIAVILDIAFNHAFGRNPMVRMWMNDPDGDGWGGPASDNPYFNTTARHSYSVGEDFNHASSHTREYVKKTMKHWITEYKIDGFRWDLTKGFTQNCQGSESCTNSYQQDRVDVLKEYADFSWNLDPYHYAIFEHLGADNEEQQWANYRITGEADGISKGIMMWGEMHSQYKQLALGFAVNGDINRMGHLSRGFSAKRLIGYPESHDKDRLAYEAKTFGNTGIQGNLNNVINRMSAIGATSLLVPGPKMIWHFQELGMDDSIFTCSNGTINDESATLVGDCKLDTKPQPQWTNNYLTTTPRSIVYNNYSKMIKLKTQEPVFSGNYSISPNGSNLRQRIYVFDTNIPTTQLRNVVILANLDNTSQSITPDFPYTGTWYNLMDNTNINVTNTTATISLAPGEFKIYGNQPTTVLSNNSFENLVQVGLYPNPAKDNFTIDMDAKSIEIYTLTGQLIKVVKNTIANNEINISDLANGMYVVKITNTEDLTASKRLIVE
jgi:1,4-alpha-glucan branching enzyme